MAKTSDKTPWVAIRADEQEALAAELGPEPGATALAVWIRIGLEAFRQRSDRPAVSLRHLAKATGLGLRTVQRRIQDLERLGFVEAVHAKYGAGAQCTTVLILKRGSYASDPMATMTTPCSHNGHGVWPMMQDVNGHTIQEGIKKETQEGTPAPAAPAPKGATRFRIPSIEEIKAYASEIGSAVDPAIFRDHYEANGWRCGKAPLKDWRAALRNWSRRGPAGTAPQRRQEVVEELSDGVAKVRLN